MDGKTQPSRTLIAMLRACVECVESGVVQSTKQCKGVVEVGKRKRRQDKTRQDRGDLLKDQAGEV